MTRAKRTVRFNGKQHVVFTAETGKETVELILTEEKYLFGETLSVEMLKVKGDWITDTFGSLTICLTTPAGQSPTRAFLDTNSYGWAEKFVRKNRLAKSLKTKCQYGNWLYPLYEFNTEKFYAKQK